MSGFSSSRQEIADNIITVIKESNVTDIDDQSLIIGGALRMTE
jgi:hypothetical protein